MQLKFETCPVVVPRYELNHRLYFADAEIMADRESHEPTATAGPGWVNFRDRIWSIRDRGQR